MNGQISKRVQTSARVVLSLSAAWSVLMMAGCSEPLLAPTDERTPFDRYDAVRQQASPQYVEDEYGRRQPNLRGRLAPRK